MEEYEKDAYGDTLDRNKSPHIISSVEKALDRSLVPQTMAAMMEQLEKINATLSTIASNTSTTNSRLTTTNNTLSNIGTAVDSIDDKITGE